MNNKEYKLDSLEQEIENNFEKLELVDNDKQEMESIYQASLMHAKKKKVITIRVQASDIEVMKVKASKLGIAYQTYINMLIHKDATCA